MISRLLDNDCMVCVFFRFGPLVVNSKNLRLAEVEDFSGRQTFQVWHNPKNLCLSGQWSGSLPRKTFSARTLKVLESRALHKPQAGRKF